MMSSRSFADRYRAVARPQADAPLQPLQQPDWPLPDGGVLVNGASGATTMFDRLYHGPDIERARLLIGHSEDRAPESRIYIDTETTGLSGGTGTYAFLIGLGWFEPAGFRVRQYFMRHPGEELALLEHVARHINEFDGLTTFNGRTFDMPLIETRFRMHRLDYAAPDDHLDLLHPARSIWKHRLESCSLGTLEQEVLGVVRQSDAPGWLIPSIYFNYLRTRSVRDLSPVIEHNRYDIVSLARLTGLVGAHLAGIEIESHPSDRLAALLARLRRGDEAVVETLLGAWQQTGVPTPLRFAAFREAMAFVKRRRQLPLYVPVLDAAMVDPSRDIRLFAAEELAKYHEHTRKDFEAALDIAQKARDSAILARDAKALAAFSHRINRLQGKVSRS